MDETAFWQSWEAVYTHRRNMKALERPAQWHANRLSVFKDRLIPCYCVSVVVLGDDSEMEEQNRYYPATRAGLAAAKAVNGRHLYKTEIEARYVLPHNVSMQSPEFESWCREWRVLL
jgi:hypothetical protein